MNNKIGNEVVSSCDEESLCVGNNKSRAADSAADQDARLVEPLDRRSFLKQAGLFSAWATSPALLLGCRTGDGQAQASDNSAPPISPAPLPVTIRPSAESHPVLQFNDTDPSHLLSIDLRTETSLLALNSVYGAGTYIPSGTLIFDPHRGIQAADEMSGFVIDLSKILTANVRNGLASEGQLTVELESNRIADPWLVDQYSDRYAVSRSDPGTWPASMGLPPFAQQSSIWRMIAEDGVGGPSIHGPAPESPSGLGTRANNLTVHLHDSSFQNMQIGVHTAVHNEFAAVTTAWWAPTSFTVYVDGMPTFLAGPAVVGPHGVQVEEAAYTMTDVPVNTAPKKLLRLFFGRTGVYIRRLVMGAQSPALPVHPLFRVCASYGDSFTHRGGFANGYFPTTDLWDAHNTYYFMRNLAQHGYRMGWCWNNSLGGGSFLKTASKSLWNNGGLWDLESLKNINPSFVMMAASHNDAAYIGRGGSAETTLYQQRLAEIKSDFLEHIQVILTGQSPNWQKTSLAGDAQIGLISEPASPSAPGWGENQVQAQRDLNTFVLHDVSEWVRANLGEQYARRIATFDAATLFGPQHLVSYNPLFQKNGTDVHPNWWGAELMNYGWWQCALKLINS